MKTMYCVNLAAGAPAGNSSAGVMLHPRREGRAVLCTPGRDYGLASACRRLPALPLAAILEPCQLMMLRVKSLPAVPAAVVLSVRVGLGHDLESLLGATLEAHLQERELMSVGTAKQGIALDVTYQARLRPSGSAHGLVMSLYRIDGVQAAGVQRRGFEEV